MKITLCGSIEFTEDMKDIADRLKKTGHEVIIPLTAKRIIDGSLTLEEFKNEKKKEKRKIDDDVIKLHFKKIGESDAVLVINNEKKGIEGYIGGNTFLEIGFAHVLSKKIFLLNPIPDIHYSDEIKAMQPIILDKDLDKIKT